MSKVLVVTYSFTGAGNRLTELLCRSRNWESASVVERRPLAVGPFGGAER